MKNNRENKVKYATTTGDFVRGFVLVLFVFFAAGLTFQTDNNARVVQVKAAYLLNLTKFVYWKSVPAAAEAVPITVGLIQAEGIAGVLEEFIKKSQGVSGITVKRLKTWDADLTGCKMVYIDQSQKDHLKNILTRTKGGGVLTVSDIEGFTKAGGMIGLILEDGKIKIEINLSEVTDSGLEVSAKLMEVARIIK